MSGGNLPQLDGLRAFAIIPVLLFHWAPGTFVMGALGVPLFFVLSGFLITGILLRYKAEVDRGVLGRGEAFKTFYFRRVLRIFPIYYLMLAIGYILDIPGFRLRFVWHLFYLSNLPPALPALDSGHFWSLAVEEQFYLIWPVILLCVPHRKIKWICLMLYLVPLLYRGMIYRGYLDSEELRLLWCSTDYLMLGAALAYLHKSNRIDVLSKIFNTYNLILLGLIVIWVRPLNGPLNQGIFPQVDIYKVVAGLLFMGVVHRCALGTFSKIANNAVLRGIGRISYGVYVYHMPLAALIGSMIPAFKMNTWANLPVKVTATLVVAVCSYYIIEKPINRFKAKVLTKCEPVATFPRTT